MSGREKRLEPGYVQTELASIQQFIVRLKEDLDSAGFAPSKVVTEGISKSREFVETAIDAMADEKLSQSLRTSKVAWIHAFFARSVLDSEMTEQYLGDQNFLELKNPVIDWKKFVEKELGELEEEIIELRKEINEDSKK